jgi:AraC-like DNA-binding protein
MKYSNLFSKTKKFVVFFSSIMYTKEQRKFILEKYFATKSYKLTRLALSQRYPGAPLPSDSTIKRLADKFRAFGSISDLPHRRSCSVRTAEKIADIQGLTLENRNVSIRKLAQQTEVSVGTVHKVLRKDLGMTPYKVTVVHELLPVDLDTRRHYSDWFIDVVQHQPDFLNTCFFSDEAWFSLSGYVNSQNSRMWSINNPHIIHETPLHPQKIGVWAAMSGKRIFHTFFEETVNSDVYCSFIHKFVETFTEEEIYLAWLQQDNAPAHNSKSTKRQLEMYFGERIIGKGLWPPRSPDLTPPDFFLWGFLKDKVYVNNPKTLEELKANINVQIASIQPQLLEKVISSAVQRAELCSMMNGAHFQQL